MKVTIEITKEDVMNSLNMENDLKTIAKNKKANDVLNAFLKKVLDSKSSSGYWKQYLFETWVESDDSADVSQEIDGIIEDAANDAEEAREREEIEKENSEREEKLSKDPEYATFKRLSKKFKHTQE